MATAGDPIVLQFRVVLRVVSPSLIWRRILVRIDTTIADLHATLQTTLLQAGERDKPREVRPPASFGAGTNSGYGIQTRSTLTGGSASVASAVRSSRSWVSTTPPVPSATATTIASTAEP